MLGIGAIGMAVWFVSFPEGMAMRSYLMHVSPTAAVVIPMSWAVLLFLSGIAQLATLAFPTRLRRYAGPAAIIAGVVWIYVGISLVQAGLLLLTWHCLLMIGGNFYVVVMFKS